MTGGPRRRIAILGGLTAIGSLGIQMVVPALPQVAADLAVGGAAAGLVVSVYLIGLAAAQLIHGPIVDAVGRRPVLIGGAAAFALASAAAWAAPGLATLLAARIAQAVAAAGVLVAARATVSDGGDAGRGASAMAYLMAIVMLSPVIAPVLGNAIAIAAGWRAVFAALGIAAAIGTVVAFACVGETLERPHPLSIASAARGWAALAGSGAFRRHALLGALASSGLYSFMTLSPFLYTVHYRLPVRWLGLQYGTIAIGAAIGAVLAGRRLARRPAGSVLRGGVIVQGAGAILVAAGLLVDRSPALLTMAMVVQAFASGLIAPSALAGAIAAAGPRRGTAASVYGAVQMAAGGLVSFVIALLPFEPATLAIALLGLAAASGVAARRSGGRNAA